MRTEVTYDLKRQISYFYDLYGTNMMAGVFQYSNNVYDTSIP